MTLGFLPFRYAEVIRLLRYIYKMTWENLFYKNCWFKILIRNSRTENSLLNDYEIETTHRQKNYGRRMCDIVLPGKAGGGKGV